MPSLPNVPLMLAQIAHYLADATDNPRELKKARKNIFLIIKLLCGPRAVGSCNSSRVLVPRAVEDRLVAGSCKSSKTYIVR